MALAVGSRLGHNDVTALIGEGGMGQVYRATDTQLGRDVALKILPDAFAADPDRLVRFQREAQVLASLNHPNIAQIHGIEKSDDTQALVLELVEGPTLADRIAKGPIPLDEALPIAKQIAEALEAAHEAGVIHRDLKPANIKVREGGTVKVLDFGLAKALDTTPEGDPSQSPTLTAAATQMGVIMGTAAYMSPEQAAGRPTDRRSDLWSFGVILLEMLTGTTPFVGDTVSQVLAEVLKSDPDWAFLPSDTPESVQRLLRRCLSKDRRTRISDASMARLEIDDSQLTPTKPPVGERPYSRPVSRAAWWSAAGVALALLIVTVIAWSAIGSDVTTQVPARFDVSLPANQQLTLPSFNQPITLSADGRQLVFVGRTDVGRQLFLKRQQDFAASPVPGTDGATFPFFSPDGQWVGFFAGGELRKISVSGGTPFTVTGGIGLPNGATWGPDERIVFAVMESGLRTVSAAGGESVPLTELAVGRGDVGHILPQFLPDGSGVLFTQLGPAEPSVALWSRASGEWRVVVEAGGGGARWLPTGHLVYARNETLFVAPFDRSRQEVTGPSLPVLDGVYTSTFRIPYFAVSDTGMLMYVPARADDALVWVDRGGVSTPAAVERERYEHPRVSPDGRRIAIDFGPGDNRQIWILDTARGVRTPLTTEGSNFLPIWTRDGSRVVFGSLRTGQWELFSKSADGSGDAQMLLEAPHMQAPGSFAPDGTLAYYEIHPQTSRDLWTLAPGGDPQPFLVTPFNEAQPSFSPDGHWIAYSSDRSGRTEVYMRPFPGLEPSYLISTEGGVAPMWGPDGDVVFYRRGEQFLSVAVQTEPTPEFGVPSVVFEGAYDLTLAGDLHYGATPDRERFLMVTEDSATTLRLVLNWFVDVERVTAGAR